MEINILRFIYPRKGKCKQTRFARACTYFFPGHRRSNKKISKINETLWFTFMNGIKLKDIAICCNSFKSSFERVQIRRKMTCLWIHVGHAISWKRWLTVSLAEEPKRPVITTEVPGPQSRSLMQELNAIQVRWKSPGYSKYLPSFLYKYITTNI